MQKRKEGEFSHIGNTQEARRRARREIRRKRRRRQVMAVRIVTGIFG